MIAAVRRFVRARVARRFFVVFVACAFLPLVAVAALSFIQVRELLLQQAEQRLAATAKSYGMSYFERMMLAADVAVSASIRGQAGRASAEGQGQGSLDLRAFEGLAVSSPDGSLRHLVGDHVPAKPSVEEAARLAAGKTVARLLPGGRGRRVEVVAPLGGGGFAAGILNPEWIWGTADELPALTDFCVVTQADGQVIHCSAPMPAAAVAGSASWEKDGERYRSRSWTQFMRAAFGQDDWTVVAAQPEAFPLARAAQFSSIYIPAVVLAALLVLWLTLRQSREIVGPVEKLAQRARGLQERNFAGKLDVRRDDELGQLATVFDEMASKLGYQFATLTALAEIDRLILTTQDTARVTHTALQRLREMTRADDLLVLLFDGENTEYARTYSLEASSEEGSGMQRQRFDLAAREGLAAMPPDWPRLEDAALPAFLEPMRARGMAAAFLAPIVWREVVCGCVVLGFRQPRLATDEERKAVTDLADRVAVAVSSAWRDQQLYEQAHYDPVTGVPNRLLFRDRLRVEIVRSSREQLQFAVLFIDLDHFKHVNDSFGHGIGDDVLREAARRLAACVRGSDSIARIGGDEFTVLLPGLRSPQEALVVAQSIVDAMSREFVVGDHHCFVSASVGIAGYPADGATEEALLKSADTAMYRAKAAGRAQAVFFEEDMNRAAQIRVALDRDLRMAIERGELVLHYQPQVSLLDGHVTGAEALVRWRHPVHGMVPPSRFIPLAEESGFIETIGQWVIREACGQMRAWRDAGVAIDRVSVNVSPRQFRRKGLDDFIARCVADAGIHPRNLEIEVTEGVLMEGTDFISSLLEELAGRGHGIALDDFGTGFSSMAYLKRFPVHLIKIDRVFVDGLRPGTDSAAIVSAVVAMGHALGKRVLAEGVETEDQAGILRDLGCDEIQGYLVSKAVDGEVVAATVRQRLAPIPA